MSACCGPTGCGTTQETSDLCPSCGVKGTSVDSVTLKALLTPEGLRRGIPPAPRYCANVDCPTVYFDNKVLVTFDEHEVVVPVHAKHPESDHVPVCYCFGHTPSSIREELLRRGKSTVTATVTAEVKAGHCACEVRNPKGSCCLGDVSRAERRLASELAVPATWGE